MTGDDAAGLTALLGEFGGLWVITRTPQGYTARRRPPPAPALPVLTAATVPGLREQLEHGYDRGKLAGLMRDFGGQWDFEALDPGSAWVAVSRAGAQPRIIAAGDLDSLRGQLGRSQAGAPGEVH
jgi:hypothetical protein